MAPRIISAILVLVFICLAVPCREVIVLSDLAAVYPDPSDSLSPVFMARKGQRLVSCVSSADDSGTIWFDVESKSLGKSGWVAAQAVRYVPDSLKAADSVLALREKSDRDDAKRRYAVLRKHPEWPRRIAQAIRNGEIVLHMTREQLVACWGTPERTAKAFMLGAGSYEVLSYHGKSGSNTVVAVQDNKVVGWSE